IEAGVVALAVIHVHGLVDALFYNTRGLLLLFIPAGIVALSSRLEPWEAQPQRTPARGTVISAAVFASLALALTIIIWSKAASTLYANLGAVAQARVELASYDTDRFNERPMDTVRREENLDAAIHYFELARARDPENLTALQRLASIDLSRGDYDSALSHMTTAWDAGHRDSVTRLLYGDALVAAGCIEQAAGIIEGLAWANARMDGQAWSRYWVHEDWTRAAYAWRTLELLEPGNAGARDRAEAAEARASQEP
ncbi:MAG: hypothetical protein P1S60_11395, partial [Anaerolineae bacterium]|nr:hypothetical protein [Anaerolineae bacterium]